MVGSPQRSPLLLFVTLPLHDARCAARVVGAYASLPNAEAHGDHLGWPVVSASHEQTRSFGFTSFFGFLFICSTS